MDRTALKGYIYELLRARSEEYRTIFRDLSFIKSAPERVDRLKRRLPDLFRANFGYMMSGPDLYLYVFTGKIYERFDRWALFESLDNFLEYIGVPAVDRTDKRIWGYIDRIINTIKDRRLCPDLSLMSFENCVVDFTKMKVYPHSAEHHCVKLYPFRYDRKEIHNCKIWKSFLGEAWLPMQELDGILPEKHKRRVLQMFLGACLVNRRDISFEYFLILQGTGANGKSVIYRVLKDLFGDDEILNIKIGQLSRTGDEQLRAAYSMDGKRLMYCTESTKKDFTDMSIVKALSSGEPIACRGIGGNITMMQRPPIMLCNSNYRWRAEDFLNREDPEDESMQRRAVVVNFEKTIPTEKRDTLLAERMKSEHAGIFAWIVKGLCELRKNHWKMPENFGGKIDAKLNRIRSTCRGINGKEVDGSVSEYLHYKRCTPDEREGASMIELTSSQLKTNYDRFCVKNGVVGVSVRKFGLDLISLGYTRKQQDNQRRYILWCDDEDIAINYTRHVPSISKEVQSSVFEGWDYTETEFIEEDFDEDSEL